VALSRADDRRRFASSSADASFFSPRPSLLKAAHRLKATADESDGFSLKIRNASKVWRGVVGSWRLWCKPGIVWNRLELRDVGELNDPGEILS